MQQKPVMYRLFFNMSERTFLIACLGNPGPEYAHTRHNIGFEIADLLAEQLDCKWEDKRFAWHAAGSVKGRKIILIKPTTYMNLSGRAVLYWLQHYKLELSQLLVVADDINLQNGQIRIKGKGSDGGHNGLRNIQDMLGTNNFPRLRFGVGNDFAPGQQVHYVLGKWPPEEVAVIKERIAIASDAVKSFALEGLERAMNKFNGA